MGADKGHPGGQAAGIIFVLMGTTFSVVGEAVDYFGRRFGHRPGTVCIIPTAQTRPYAELAKQSLIRRYNFQPPYVRIEQVSIDDVTSTADFMQLVADLSIIVDAVISDPRRKGSAEPLMASITGGRKTMSIAGMIVFSRKNAIVVDTRSHTADDDRALLSQISARVREGLPPEEIYDNFGNVVDDLAFRKADIAYEIPHISIDVSRSAEGYSDVL